MTGRQKMAIGWTVLCIGTPVIWFAIFIVMEAYGLHHEDAITLSRFLWEIGEAWRPAVFFSGLLIGLVIGTLATHLWWQWDPLNAQDHRG